MTFKETTYWMNNKILKGDQKIHGITTLFLLLHSMVYAQNLPPGAYGMTYINNISLYKKSIIDHPEKEMVPIGKIKGLVLDLRYATPDNFTHKRLYPAGTTSTFLRKRVYQALDSVGVELSLQGISLVIFDAYRPYSITVELWNRVKDDRYAANPAKGSGHNRGIAVDLSLADAKTHQLLPMPTDFDNFSDSAHQDFSGTDAKRIANRELLKLTMEKYGFIPLSTEWWHFSWPAPGDYEVMDLSFRQLSDLEKKQ
jgi:D-alanyl-D-alanine dipeptidase